MTKSRYDNEDLENYPLKEKEHGLKFCSECQHKVRHRITDSWENMVYCKCSCGNTWKYKQFVKNPYLDKMGVYDD